MTKGEMTRQRILEAAAPILNRQGFTGCSMADIMEATGLEKGGIYRHFASKEELAAEALGYAISEVRRERLGDYEEIPGALNQLRTMMDRFVSRPGPIDGGCPLFNGAVETDDGNETMRAMVQAGFADWRKRVMTIVRKGVRDGEMRASCDPAELADTVIATLEGALVLSRLDGNKKPLERARRSLELLLQAHTKVA